MSQNQKSAVEMHRKSFWLGTEAKTKNKKNKQTKKSLKKLTGYIGIYKHTKTWTWQAH